jgi:hypothetical protein
MSYYADDDDYVEVYNTSSKFSISDEDVEKIVAKVEKKGIKVYRFDYPTFKRREIRLGDYEIGKWDLESGVYDHFDIAHSEHEWHSEPKISTDDPVIKIIAKYVKDGSYLELENRVSRCRFRWVFNKGKVKEVYPKVLYVW